LSSKEIRVSTSFRYPVDPMNIVSMADYDLALLLTRNWFDFDGGRTAKPGLISSWNFDQKEAGYFFEIAKKSKWSNGQTITSEELLFNLKRILHSDSSYGKALSGIVDDKRIKVVSETKFFIGVKGQRPNDAFFQRMGSIFMASVDPKMIDQSGKIVSNQNSAGPYQVESVSDKELILVKNKNWSGHDLQKSPEKIIFRKPIDEFKLTDFIEKKSWENITQISSMMPLADANRLSELKLPMWSRDHDRVSLMRPVSGPNLSKRKALIKKIWELKNKVFSDVQLPVGVRQANSLQPIGYPLFEDLSVKNGEVGLKEVHIAATESVSSRAQETYLASLFASIGVKAKWTFVTKDKFIPLLKGDSSFDFIFFDFGVADPEPITWVGLIFNMEFVYLDDQDRKKFEMATKLKDRVAEIKSLQEFLSGIANKGGYVPFFHFSTVSVGQPGISFKNIRELDETVDFSKVELE
jgi:MarR-like DNA-binding transcriptional regulator SgrR of sgrS sRNA